MNGQENNQQPIQTPTLPVPQDPGFMTNVDPTNLDFLFNEETGALEIGAKVTPQTTPQVDQQFQNALEQQQTQQAQPAQLSPMEQEVSILKETVGQLIGYLQSQEQGRLNNLSQPQNQQVAQQEAPLDFEGLDLSDPKNLVAVINLSVQNALKPHIASLSQVSDKVNIKNSFDSAAAKYGQDFLAVLPKINFLFQSGVLKGDPNMSFENIYLAIKQMDALNAQSAKSDGTIQAVNGSNGNGQSRQPQTAQALVQKANALSTESGGVQRNLINNEKPKVGNVKDAFDAAWQELYGTR